MEEGYNVDRKGSPAGPRPSIGVVRLNDLAWSSLFWGVGGQGWGRIPAALCVGSIWVGVL